MRFSFVLLIALAGCGQPDKMISVCVKSHTEHTWMMVGKVFMQMPRRVCDEREWQSNPRYAKWAEKQGVQ